MSKQAALPSHIVWSTDRLDLTDPFQRLWYIRQVLLYGRAEDVQALDLAEVAASLDQLDLPADLRQLWEVFLRRRSDAQR